MEASPMAVTPEPQSTTSMVDFDNEAFNDDTQSQSDVVNIDLNSPVSSFDDDNNNNNNLNNDTNNENSSNIQSTTPPHSPLNKTSHSSSPSNTNTTTSSSPSSTTISSSSSINNPDWYNTTAQHLSSQILIPSKDALNSFFYPPPPPPPTTSPTTTTNSKNSFWRAYDDIIILSVATQIGMLIRILSSSILKLSDNPTFHANSALFTNLPLNVLACTLMGLLTEGERAWTVVKRGGGEWRTVQVEGMERRLRRCRQSVLLFMAKREEEDVMEHYEDEEEENEEEEGGCCLDEESDEEEGMGVRQRRRRRGRRKTRRAKTLIKDEESLQNVNKDGTHLDKVANDTTSTKDPMETASASSFSSDEDIHGVNAPTTDEILDTIKSIGLGWYDNTTPTAMSNDLMLGLRVGFCGALSSFSSWNSEMVNLLRQGMVGQAIMGYIIGLALPILGYSMGIQIAIYIFVWRCRHQASREARRGYYGRTNQEELPDDDVIDDDDSNGPTSTQQQQQQHSRGERLLIGNKPSVRAVFTAFFVLSMLALILSLFIFHESTDQQMIVYSLVFSPLGVLTRWRLDRYNGVLVSFPLGTFAANLISVALCGSLGSLLAGSPGSEERIVLQSLISGFAGSLSTLATFVVQVTDRIDPITMRYDGMIYAFVMVFWGMVVGFVTRQAKNWADDL